MAEDASRHDDLVTFTVQLSTHEGEVAWAARVFVLLGETGRIREDYQLTVQPLAGVSQEPSTAWPGRLQTRPRSGACRPEGEKGSGRVRGRGISGQQVGERVADGLAVHLAGDQGGRVVRGTPVDVQLVVVAGEDQVAAGLGGLSGSLGGVLGYGDERGPGGRRKHGSRVFMRFGLSQIAFRQPVDEVVEGLVGLKETEFMDAEGVDADDEEDVLGLRDQQGPPGLAGGSPGRAGVEDHARPLLEGHRDPEIPAYLHLPPVMPPVTRS